MQRMTKFIIHIKKSNKSWIFLAEREDTLSSFEDSFGVSPLNLFAPSALELSGLNPTNLMQNKKAPTCVRTFLFWLGWEDSNRRDARVKVWCLTTWLQPNI